MLAGQIAGMDSTEPFIYQVRDINQTQPPKKYEPTRSVISRKGSGWVGGSGQILHPRCYDIYFHDPLVLGRVSIRVFVKVVTGGGWSTNHKFRFHAPVVN